MEKREASTKPKGACEKIYKAVAENCPFRSIHRRSRRSQSPMSENATVGPNHSGGRASDSPSKTHFFLRKLVAPHKPRPGEVNIPIQTGPSMMMNEKEKMANPSVAQQSNGRVIVISSPKTQPADHSTTIKPTVVSVKEKPKQKAETEIPPSNLIVVEGPGQGINTIATPRVEPAAKPHMPVQGLQPKPKSQPAASAVKVIAKQDAPTNDIQGKEDKKKPENAGAHDHNLKYSDYIKRVNNQLRTKSDVGEETITARPPTRTPTRRDSFNDRVSNFIMRATNDIKTTHLGD